MIQTLIHSSENSNLYIYDDQRRLSMLVHPEFVKAYEKSMDANPYYLKKYAYLKEHDFFAKPKLSEFVPLEESIVKDNIVNTHQIVFETTDACNLNCTYCALGNLYEGYDERDGKKMNIRYATNLLKYVFDFKPKSKNNILQIGFYGGEALLNMNFIKKIVETSEQLNITKGIQLEYSMTTNATLIHKHIDFLVTNKFHLLISLDGNEKNHSYRTFKNGKKNSFQKVIENVDLIQNVYPEYFSTHVDFNAVLHNQNSVKEIYGFIYTKYHKIPRVSELNLRDIRPENGDFVTGIYRGKRNSEAELQKENPDLFQLTHNQLSSYNDLINFLKYCSVNYYISNINALLHSEEKYLQTNTCTPFFKKLFLTSCNKLLPCEKISYQYSMGKVNENIEIDISIITQQYNFYYECLKKFCQNCYAYRFCGTCLFHLKNIDNLNTEEFVCDNFCDKKDYKDRLFNLFSFLEKYPTDFSEILENIKIE